MHLEGFGIVTSTLNSKGFLSANQKDPARIPIRVFGPSIKTGVENSAKISIVIMAQRDDSSFTPQGRKRSRSEFSSEDPRAGKTFMKILNALNDVEKQKKRHPIVTLPSSGGLEKSIITS